MQTGLDLCIFDDMCCEERWYKIFADIIQPYHQLEKLHIIFNWLEISDDGWRKGCITREEDRNALRMWRSHLLYFLNDHVRGIRGSKLESHRTRTEITALQLQGISMAMTRNRRTAVPRQMKQKLTLSEALRNVSLCRAAYR